MTQIFQNFTRTSFSKLITVAKVCFLTVLLACLLFATNFLIANTVAASECEFKGAAKRGCHSELVSPEEQFVPMSESLRVSELDRAYYIYMQRLERRLLPKTQRFRRFYAARSW